MKEEQKQFSDKEKAQKREQLPLTLTKTLDFPMTFTTSPTYDPGS